VNTILRTFSRALVAFLFLVAPALPAFAKAERVALVIGNGAYERKVDQLPNPMNDAERITETLEELGFTVIKGLNVDRRSFIDSLLEFERMARQAKVALFFYAGHGMQWGGESYLVPTDVTLRTETDVEQSVSVERVMRTLQSEVNIVFLDACRDTPMLEELALSTGKTRSAARKYRGATRVREDSMKENSTFLMFATQDGEPAVDGLGTNSPFTQALVANMVKPGVSLLAMVAPITREVKDLTNGAQVPMARVTLTVDFQFVEEPKTTTHADDELWAWVADSKDPSRIHSYLVEFPNGNHARMARARLRAAITEAVNSDVLRSYISGYPHSEFLNMARARLAQLENMVASTAVVPDALDADSTDRDLVMESSPPQPVEQAVDQSTSASGSVEQTAHLNTAGPDDLAFSSAKASGTVSAYQQYLAAFPRGKHADEAQRRIGALQKARTGLRMWEDKLWRVAQKSKDPVDCEIYLEAYPDGAYRRSAEKCLAKLS
jgi:hypothetical protein